MKVSPASGASATRHIHVDRERIVDVETTIAKPYSRAQKAGLA